MSSKSLSEMSLEELWQLFPIILCEYNPQWVTWYKEESVLLSKIFGNCLFRIRHIGSTSVPRAVAKPTVDILLEAVPETSPQTLLELGTASRYLVMAESFSPNYQLDLCKGYMPDGFASRVFHLHVRYPGDWDEPIFCEFLRSNPEYLAQYIELKRNLKERFEHNRDAYTESKGNFIRNCVRIARERG